MEGTPVLSQHPYAPLRVGNFRWLLLSHFAIALATQIQGVVVAWQIYSITKDPLSLGLIGLAEALPFIVVALFAGHAADTKSRKWIALWSLATLLACALALLLLSLASNLAGLEWAIYGVIVLSGIARSFLGPARMALSAEVVPRELYPSSVTWRTGTWQVAAVSGPALGSGLYTLGKEQLAYGVTVALAFAALLLQAAVHPAARRTGAARVSIWKSLGEGITFLFQQKVVLSAISLDLFAVLFGGAVALLPEMNVKTAMKLFDDAEAEVLAVLESADSRKVIGFLSESFARRRYVEEIDQATRGVLGALS